MARQRAAAERGLIPTSSCLAALCVCSLACCAGLGLETSLRVGPYLIGCQAGVHQQQGLQSGSAQAVYDTQCINTAAKPLLVDKTWPVCNAVRCDQVHVSDALLRPLRSHLEAAGAFSEGV